MIKIVIRHSILGSVLPGFLLSFPSQIWVSDVTFVTFFRWQKMCRVTFVTFLERMWRSRARIFFLTSDVFCHTLLEKCHILALPVPNFFEREEMWRFGWDWNIFFSSRLRFHISRKREAGRPFGLRPTLSVRDAIRTEMGNRGWGAKISEAYRCLETNEHTQATIWKIM